MKTPISAVVERARATGRSVSAMTGYPPMRVTPRRRTPCAGVLPPVNKLA